MSFDQTLQHELECQGADFVRFIDISHLSYEENKGFPLAVLFGKILSGTYLKEISEIPDYVEKLKKNNGFDNDEFNVTEKKTDQIADYIAEYISLRGYAVYSQSEKNICNTGYYDESRKRTPLPHKTIAGLSGLGWIGKHDLLVMPDYGSAISMCSVLTNAPLETITYKPADSKCGDCFVCRDVCPTSAIKGANWNTGIERENLINVDECITCLKCMVFCPWTQKYMKEKISK